MGIYIFIAVFFGLLYALRRDNNTFIVFASVILIAFSALRKYTVGIDHMAYRSGFLSDIPNLSLKELTKKWEIGWIFLNEFIISVYNDWSLMLFVVALLTVLPCIYVFRKGTPDALLSIWLYFLFYYYILPFSLIKQGVAISLLLLAVYFFNRGNSRKSLLAYVVACTMHYSAILMLPIVYFSNKMKVKPKTAVIIMASTFAVGLVGFEGPLRNLIELLPYEKYSHYAEYKSDVKFDRLNFYLYLLPKNIACSLIFLYLKKEGMNLYKNLLFLGMVVGNFFITISLISRFVLYTYPFEIILLTHLIYQYQGKKRRIVRFWVVFYALLYFIYNLMRNRGGVIPYELNI